MNETNTNNPQNIIRRIIQELHMNVRAFALGMNEPYSKIFDIYNGRTKTIVQSVQRSIMETYGVNRHFLQTGNGEVFAHTSTAPASSDELTNSFLKVIATMSEENKKLKMRVAELEAELKRIAESLPDHFTNGVFNG